MNAFTRDPAAIRKLPLFSPLTETQFAWLVPAIQFRTYSAGKCILHSGEAPDGLYIIIAGRVRVMHDDGQGHALIVADYGPGEFFGEMGLIDSAPCPANIHVVDACEVAYVPRKILLECIEDNAAGAVYMLRTALDRLCAAHRKMADLALMNVYGRVARVLLDNGREADGSWLVEPGSERIAAMVGASREMVSRVIKHMIGKGTVRRHKRKLIVLDRAALACASVKGSASRRGNGEAATGSETLR